MKLSVGIAAALASCASAAASAAQQAAQVYILAPSSSSSSSSSAPPPAVPRSVARLILLQRLAASGKGPSVNELPDNVDADEVIALLNQYAGSASPSLFDKDGAEPMPSQLLVMLEGMTAEQMEKAGGAFDTPAFTIENPPSAKAHEKLFKLDFYNAGLTNEHGCSLDQVANPFKEECWSGKSTVARYDVSKDSAVLGELLSNLKALNSLSRNGEMETTIVLTPSVAEGTAPNSWSDKPQELRRRQAEQPMAGPHAANLDVDEIVADDDESSSVSGTSPVVAADPPVFHGSKASIHGCFNSEDACSTATRNCSGHGQCQDKYANPDGSKSKTQCFTCHCMSTVSDSGSLTHWAGGACSKKDISVPFWLFAGFTLAMVGIVSMAIGMLYSIGEEKLPGVIGAGVAKSNK